MPTRRLALAAIAATAVASFPARRAGAADTNLTITIPSIDIADSPYFIAQQKGYFAAEGLHVDFSFTGGGVATPALIAGSVQGSASGSAALSAILRDANLRVVAVCDDSPAYQLWARNDIRALKDLQGKTIGIATRGDTFEMSTRLVLQDAGFPPDSVAYTPLGFGAGAGAAMAGGGLPAVVLARSEVRQLQAEGQLKNAHLLLNYFGKLKMTLNAFAVSQKYMTDNPDVVRRMMRAIVKGSRYALANKNQTVAIVAKYQKDPSMPSLLAAYDEFTASFVPTLTIPVESATKDLAVRAAMINVASDKIVPVDKAYDFSMVRSINAELDASKWKPVP